jgi:Flp pilus assembly protein TadD
MAMMQAALYLDPTSSWRVSYASLLDILGRHQDAMAEIETAAYLDPRLSSHPYLDPRGKHLPAVLLLAAERGLRRSVDERRDDPVLLNQVATFYYRFEKWIGAAEFWIRAGELTGDAAYGARAAGALARAGEYQRAEELAKRAVQLEPDESRWYRLLAMEVYRPQKRYDEAKRTLEAGVERTRDPALIYVALSDLIAETGDKAASLAALATAAERRERDPRLQYRLGIAYMRNADYHRAKIAFGRAIQIDPANAAYHHQLGLALEQLYDLLGARTALRHAVELDSTNETYARSLKRVEDVFHDTSATRPAGSG